MCEAKKSKLLFGNDSEFADAVEKWALQPMLCVFMSVWESDR